MTCPQDVGRVLLLRVHKTPPALLRPFWPLASDAWFCRWFQLTPPRGAPLRFPCYQWLEDKGSLVLREGTGEGDTGGRRGWCVGGKGKRSGEVSRVWPRGRDRGGELGSLGEGGAWQSGVGETVLMGAGDLVRGGWSGGESGWGWRSGGFLCPPHLLRCSHSEDLLGRPPPHPPAAAPGGAAGQAGDVQVRRGLLVGGGCQGDEGQPRSTGVDAV